MQGQRSLEVCLEVTGRCAHREVCLEQHCHLCCWEEMLPVLHMEIW